MIACLSVDALSCIRHNQLLFKNIAFALYAGEILLVEGHNGTGKSSLLRLLSGLSTPTTGKIFWQGSWIESIHDKFTSNLHYVGHLNGIKLGLSVIENIQLSCHLSAVEMPNYQQLLKQLALHTHQHTQAYHLSAGQKRRLSLSKLLLVPKPLWILDEPFTALDTSSQDIFLQHLETHLGKGGICVLSSHHPLCLQKMPYKYMCLPYATTAQSSGNTIAFT